MNIINTSTDFLSVFDAGCFNIDKWSAYMDAWIPGAKELCLRNMQDYIKAGYSWQDVFLPVLNLVTTDFLKREKAVKSFQEITNHLDARIEEIFGRPVDADIVLYIGLCNGAGWVTKVNGKTTVLLGIEKIIELDWCDTDSMTGLIVHETGHVFHSQYGSFKYDTHSTPEKFLWQLYTEGVAMVFEQEVIGNTAYFHQDKDGWKKWCDQHTEHIKRSFLHDLNTMTQENQRYFGDWVSFEGYKDVGYYLGTLFIRHLLQLDCFDNIIKYSIQEVKNGYDKFMDLNR